MTHHPQENRVDQYRAERAQRGRRKHKRALPLRVAEEVRVLDEIPTGIPNVQALAARYRAWLKGGGEAAGLGPDPLEARDAHYECLPHGRLPHDAWRDPECRCWHPVLAEREALVTA